MGQQRLVIKVLCSVKIALFCLGHVILCKLSLNAADKICDEGNVCGKYNGEEDSEPNTDFISCFKQVIDGQVR